MTGALGALALPQTASGALYTTLSVCQESPKIEDQDCCVLFWARPELMSSPCFFRSPPPVQTADLSYQLRKLWEKNISEDLGKLIQEPHGLADHFPTSIVTSWALARKWHLEKPKSTHRGI